MKKFFGKHREWLLVVGGFIFMSVIVVYFVLGVGIITESLNDAFTPTSSVKNNEVFDLDGARSLKLGELPQ